ncbi:hypothetical protein EGW08_010995 [Elysia chlorotica]|uniref:Uncharacterized protein n=1 Tax=Elysia chlorotica TaxID=188477 RepID=A0A3S1BD74_ELYCH|nr:hypothetical protein EGW08_010995 [Elysia chlorotica]
MATGVLLLFAMDVCCEGRELNWLIIAWNAARVLMSSMGTAGTAGLAVGNTFNCWPDGDCDPGVIDDPVMDVGIADPDIEGPDIEGPGIEGPGIEDPGMEDPDIDGIVDPDIDGMEDPDIDGIVDPDPDMDDPDVDDPGIGGPEIVDPDIVDPGIDDPDIDDPDIDDPGIDDPDIPLPDIPMFANMLSIGFCPGMKPESACSSPPNRLDDATPVSPNAVGIPRPDAGTLFEGLGPATPGSPLCINCSVLVPPLASPWYRRYKTFRNDF